MKSFKNKLNESFDVNEGKANYSLAYNKMDKFMNDDPDAQDEFYDIEDEDEMAEFLELNIIDDGNFFSYAGKKATYKGFAKYLLKNTKGNESLNEDKQSLFDWFTTTGLNKKSHKAYLKAGYAAGFKDQDLAHIAQDYEQGGDDYVDTKKYKSIIAESLNEGKSDLYKTVLKEATTSEQKKYFKEAIKELDLDKNLSKDDLVKVGNWLIDNIGSDAMDMIEHIGEITGVELG